jgi:curved DNA-binding protein CbpA
LYAVLRVPPTASAAEIRAAFACAALSQHPDKGGSSSAFQALQAAYEILRDEKARADYDATLAADAVASAALPVCEEVPLLDFRRREDGVFAFSCRCGDAFELSLADAAAGVNVLACGGCSLRVKVVS